MITFLCKIVCIYVNASTCFYYVLVYYCVDCCKVVKLWHAVGHMHLYKSSIVIIMHDLV